jgi:hypothetical protein
MKLNFEQKLIKSFLGEIEKPILAPVEAVNVGECSTQSIQPEIVSNFSLSKLQNTAKEISEFTAYNINALYRDSNIKRSVDEAIFMDFFFCGSKLAGNFKTFYNVLNENDINIQVESRSYVYWDGNKLTIE